MYPDITKAIPSNDGMKVILTSVRLSPQAHGNGKEWDLFAVMGVPDENDRVVPHAISIATRGTKRQMKDLLKSADGKYVSVSGVFGAVEHSSSGSECFRRIYAKIKDIKIIKNS
jgi:hypothetical protein